MKKTIILSAFVLAFSATNVNANSLTQKTVTPTVENPSFTASSPLHLAIVQDDFDTVKRLIELGADLDEKWNGMTPVMYAARYNHIEILKLLINSGANLKAKCDKGHTAKYYAKVSNATAAETLITQALAKKK